MFLEIGLRFRVIPPAAATPPIPEAVKGWREYPLRDGVISIQPVKWRTDTIDVPVPAGKGLEYKLTMKKGQGLVYNISYGTLADPAMMFTAPWDHIHGWYLKNDSPKEVVVKLELAGFYVLESK